MDVSRETTDEDFRAKVVGRRVDQAKSIRGKELMNNLLMNSPLTKTAAAFGLKTNIVKCPFCEEMFGIGRALGDHIAFLHKAESQQLDLFGCNKCDSWYGWSKAAMVHHRKKGCQLRVRTVGEAKNHPSKKVVGRKGRMVVQARSLAAREFMKNRWMNLPLTKWASIFCLKSNVVKCPFCEEMFGISSALDEHFKVMHIAEREQRKLFGCNKCDAWYGTPKSAMVHHVEKGCKLRVRTIDEAKNHVPKKTAGCEVHFEVRFNQSAVHSETVGRRGAMVDQVKSLAAKEAGKHRMMNSPLDNTETGNHRLMNGQLSKTAVAFGLKINIVKCPFCEGIFGIGGELGEHLRVKHEAEKKVKKLFGCDKCNAWYGLPDTAMEHYRKQGCKLRVRTIDEAKNHSSKKGCNLSVRTLAEALEAMKGYNNAVDEPTVNEVEMSEKKKKMKKSREDRMVEEEGNENSELIDETIIEEPVKKKHKKKKRREEEKREEGNEENAATMEQPVKKKEKKREEEAFEGERVEEAEQSTVSEPERKKMKKGKKKKHREKEQDMETEQKLDAEMSDEDEVEKKKRKKKEKKRRMEEEKMRDKGGEEMVEEQEEAEQSTVSEPATKKMKKDKKRKHGEKEQGMETEQKLEPEMNEEDEIEKKKRKKQEKKRHREEEKMRDEVGEEMVEEQDEEHERKMNGQAEAEKKKRKKEEKKRHSEEKKMRDEGGEEMVEKQEEETGETIAKKKKKKKKDKKRAEEGVEIEEKKKKKSS